MWPASVVVLAPPDAVKKGLDLNLEDINGTCPDAEFAKAQRASVPFPVGTGDAALPQRSDRNSVALIA